jgi:nucleoid-associated protein YgaU
MYRRLTTHTRRPQRLVAIGEVLAVVVGIPALLLATIHPGGGLHRPIMPSSGSFHAFVEAPAQVKLTDLAHLGVWVVWLVWAYCALAFTLSCMGFVAQHLRFSGPASAVLRIRNRVVPASVRLILDSVFVAAVMAPALRASAAVGHLPGRPAVTQLAPQAERPPPVLVSGRSGGQAGSSPGGASTHTVVRGDTMSGVARADCGDAADWRTIAAANPQITNPNLIHPGDQLAIPCTPAAAATPSDAQGVVVHTVTPGESLYSIVAHYAPAGTSEAEIGERAMQLFTANRDRAVSPDGTRLERPRFIEAGWTLVIPASVQAPPRVPVSAHVVPAPPTAPAPDPALVAPALPDPTPPTSPPAAAPASVSAGGSSTVATPKPRVEPEAVGGVVTTRPASAPQGRTHGIRVPGGWIPFGLAAGLAGVAYLAKLRRWSRRQLARRERRRPLGPVLGAIARADRILDALTPHTLALLEVYQAGKDGLMPRVLGAWEAERGVAFVLDAQPDELPPSGEDRARSFRVDFGERDGKAVGVTTLLAEPKSCLRREVVPFIDELLVPVGRGEAGWLHLPLLNAPVSVVGRAARKTAWAMLMAAGVRSGDQDLRISVAGDVLGEARLPEGVEFPAIETIPADQLQGLPGVLAEEAVRRLRGIQARGFESFADLQALETASMPAWVLVLDPVTAGACASQLDELASLGVGAIVLGEWTAPRQVIAAVDRVSVTAPGVGSIEGLEPVALDRGVVEELEELITDPPEAAGALDAELAGALEDGRPQDGQVTGDPAPTSARICLYVLGGFRATRDGEEISMTATSSALARELVARLAVAGSVPAKVLRKDLWPDDLEPEVNKNQPLFQLISRARAWLRGGGIKEEVIEFIKARTESEGGSYSLRGVWVDLVAFRQAIGMGSREGLEEAVRLYTGELLAGQESDRHFRWVLTGDFRDDERFRFFRAAADLARMLLDDDPDQALDVLDRALSEEGATAVEELACLAMRCEAAKGNVDGIRRRYGRLCAALERDEASGETAQLYRELLAGLDRPPAPRPRPPSVRQGGPDLRVVAGRSASAVD